VNGFKLVGDFVSHIHILQKILVNSGLISEDNDVLTLADLPSAPKRIPPSYFTAMIVVYNEQNYLSEYLSYSIGLN
jgi:hypothetical protein